ncbi:GRF1-interacting factor 3-like [Musa acuminata AAA Group]|uniref:GRF1-interacting factor 3 n=1 Tax=Musa acuminata AAA Group TaxID=214697 RepID=UPI0031CDE60B
MQQPVHPMTPMAPILTANITTEEIQKYLDENKQLILAILENQNLGKLAECAQYQAQLQRNLLYLAAIADAQPQAHAVRPPMMPQGGHFMQQAPVFPPRVPLQFPQQRPEQHLHHHQVQAMPFPVQMDMRTGAMNDMHPLPPSHAATLRQPHDGQGSKQDASAADLGAREPEQSHAKRPEDLKTP